MDKQENRPGAPDGNVNALKNGMRSNRHGLVHAKLSRKFGNAYGQINQLRKAIESLLIEKHGGVSLIQQAKIQSIVRLETGCRAVELTERENDSMDPEQLRAQRHSIAQWTRERDNLLSELLGNSCESKDPWAALDASSNAVHTQADVPSPPESDNASEPLTEPLAANGETDDPDEHEGI